MKFTVIYTTTIGSYGSCLVHSVKVTARKDESVMRAFERKTKLDGCSVVRVFEGHCREVLTDWSMPT
jgi:hypothetical protein